MDPSHGGPCQGIRYSIPEMERLQVHNEVVCLDDPNAGYLGKDQFLIHAIGLGKGPWWYCAKLIPWLVDNFHRFDVIILHGLWQYPGYAVRKALNHFVQDQLTRGEFIKKAPKLYVMPHGMLDPYFQKATGRKLKAIRNWVYWKLIENKVINEADGILFTCEEELLLAREPFRPYRPKKELNVGYGITDPPKKTAAMKAAFMEKCPQLQNRPYLLFLSRIHEKKGVDLLIQAYSKIVYTSANTEAPVLSFANMSARDRLLKQYENTEMPALVIVGPGLESPYGQQLQQIAGSSPKLKNSVHFVGMLSGDAKWGALYGCEALVLPSHQENFGIAVVEALACEKPVLISNQINIHREIEIAGGGIVADDTVEGTRYLLESWNNFSNEKKKKYSDQARKLYQTTFAVGPAAKRMFQLLENANSAT